MELEIVHYSVDRKDELSRLFNEISLQLFVETIPDSLLFKNMGAEDSHYDRNYIVAYSEESIVGILGYMEDLERGVTYLSVIESFLKRKGIGTALIGEFKGLVKTDGVCLYTYPQLSKKDREGARSFFEKNGFEVEEYYPKENQYRMSWHKSRPLQQLVNGS